MTQWDMHSMRQSKHPSNLLYNNTDAEGDRLAFDQAMKLCIAQADGELLDWRNMSSDNWVSPDEITHAVANLEALKAAAEEALAIYLAHADDVSGRDAVVTAFGDSPVDWKQAIAETAFENVYSALAI